MLGITSALALASLADLPATAQSTMSNDSMMNHRSSSNSSMMNRTSSARTNYYYSTRMLMRGSTGPAVRRLQNTLKTQGFFRGRINGNYDSWTEPAVMRFQRANGLVVDGIVGPNTRAVLY